MGFFGSFFGNDQRRDLERSNRQANKQLTQGFNQQQGYYDQAYNLFNPYMQQGQAANAFYNNMLGLGGADAQKAAYDQFMANPLFQAQSEQNQTAAQRALNARGSGGGGQAQLAAQRVAQQTAGNWLDRYADQGRQGLQAAGMGANVRMGQGDNAYGYGATRANQAVNYGNALADSRNIGVNNLMGLAGTAARAYGAYKMPTG